MTDFYGVSVYFLELPTPFPLCYKAQSFVLFTESQNIVNEYKVSIRNSVGA